jgi:hypothetical protein
VPGEQHDPLALATDEAEQRLHRDVAAVLHRQHHPGHDEPGEELLRHLLRPVEAAGVQDVARDDVGREDHHQHDAGQQQHALADERHDAVHRFGGAHGAREPLGRDRHLLRVVRDAGRDRGGVERLLHVRRWPPRGPA